MNKLKKQTSEYWYKEYIKKSKTRILDPDGWDRSNYQYSFYEEKITEEEFATRMMWSTCMHYTEDYKKRTNK